MNARRIAIAVVAVSALQALAVALYFVVERSRRGEAPFAVERLSGEETAGELLLEDPTGAPVSSGPGRVRLLHFWATWCPPCRTELPGLLALSAELDGVDVIAVSADDGWAPIARFFDGEIPAPVVRLRDPAALRRLGATTLPDTYLVSSRDRLVARFAGPRDWTSPAARAALAEELRRCE